MACLAAPYGRRDPTSGPRPLSLGEGAPAEYDRDTLCVSTPGLDPAGWPPGARDRGLRAVDTRVRGPVRIVTPAQTRERIVDMNSKSVIPSFPRKRGFRAFNGLPPVRCEGQ